MSTQSQGPVTRTGPLGRERTDSTVTYLGPRGQEQDRGVRGHIDVAYQEADDVVALLRDALGRIGVTLPSLGVDDHRIGDVHLVELGRVRPDVARRLADVIGGGRS
ncbi:hypothetical protein [Streptomyces sp. NPDC047108]|uniref:hypothetical protein n=1 Tax=Streptomyces sp. NPDC047108 TaxID=3155025 RepID=UPI0033E96932